MKKFTLDNKEFEVVMQAKATISYNGNAEELVTFHCREIKNAEENPQFKVGQVWEDEDGKNRHLIFIAEEDGIEFVDICGHSDDMSCEYFISNYPVLSPNQSIDDFPVIPNPNYKQTYRCATCEKDLSGKIKPWALNEKDDWVHYCDEKCLRR